MKLVEAIRDLTESVDEKNDEDVFPSASIMFQ
jgi:hypothetical protein